jgi:hypothetical protein
MKNYFRKLSFFVFITSLVLLSCGVEKEATKIGDISTGSQSSESVEEAGEVIYQVGDIVRIDQTVLVVLGWDQPPGGDFNPPDEGKKYLVIDLMIANQGDRSFNITPAFQMTLKHPDGKKYNVNGKANLSSGVNPPSGEVNPGEIIRGKVGFHVPEDLTNFRFIYEANLIGLGEVSVDLGTTPVAMDPPADLNLGGQQKVFQIGDMVEVSDLVIQVLEVSYPGGSGIVQPKEGFKFVGIDVQVDNQGEAVKEITSVIQMYLKDSTGQKYTFHLGAQSLMDTGLPDDELQAGERIRGQIGYQVPENIGVLIFVFDAEIFGFGKAFISLE